MQVLEKVAKAVSRNYGINLVFKGTQAMTDGKTIYLPSLPPDCPHCRLRLMKTMK